MQSYIPEPHSDVIQALCEELRQERVLFDLNRSSDLDILRKDVSRIARAMDDPAQPPPMFWSGIPLPSGQPSRAGGYCLVISVGGTNTNYLMIRLQGRVVVALAPSGKEVFGDDMCKMKKTCSLKTGC